MSVASNIRSGAYASKLAKGYGIASAKARDTVITAHKRDEERLLGQFRLDVEAENNVSNFDPRVRDAIWQHAYESGIEHGLFDVAAKYATVCKILQMVAIKIE